MSAVCLWLSFRSTRISPSYILKGFEQTCWAIHMILLILLGTLAGVMFKEWKGSSVRTKWTLAAAITLLIAGKLLLDYGNYLGQQAS